jgi:hypothetical protein
VDRGLLKKFKLKYSSSTRVGNRHDEYFDEYVLEYLHVLASTYSYSYSVLVTFHLRGYSDTRVPRGTREYVLVLVLGTRHFSIEGVLRYSST